MWVALPGAGSRGVWAAQPLLRTNLSRNSDAAETRSPHALEPCRDGELSIAKDADIQHRIAPPALG